VSTRSEASKILHVGLLFVKLLSLVWLPTFRRNVLPPSSVLRNVQFPLLYLLTTHVVVLRVMTQCSLVGRFVPMLRRNVQNMFLQIIGRYTDLVDKVMQQSKTRQYD
jgi:hypothetical protein